MTARRFLRAFVPLAALGCASLLGVVPLLAPAVESLRLRPELGRLPTAGLYAVLLAQPAVLVVALTAAGVALVGAIASARAQVVLDGSLGTGVQFTYDIKANRER